MRGTPEERTLSRANDFGEMISLGEVEKLQALAKGNSRKRFDKTQQIGDKSEYAVSCLAKPLFITREQNYENYKAMLLIILLCNNSLSRRHANALLFPKDCAGD